jgi:RNA polymerase sigma-70 factor (ECF subfamily)
MDQDQHREVVRGLQDGRTEAWQQLYDEHAEPVWRLVARVMAPGCADIGDVVQETFLAAARSARQFDPARGSLWSWLSGIARRQVALYYRRQKKRPGNPTAAPGGDRPEPRVADRELPPVDAAEKAELALRIRLALTQLPADYETLLVAKYMQEATIEEIAVVEQATPEATRSKLARARRAFRKVFSNCSNRAVEGGLHGQGQS